MLVHVAPLLIVYSNLTDAIPCEVQVMLCTIPVVNDSPPLGDITVIDGALNIVNELVLCATGSVSSAS